MSNPYPDYKRNTITLPVAKHPAQQEPVASIFISGIGEREFDDWGIELPMGRNLLYTSPPAQRTWQGLTDAELVEFSSAELGPYDLCLEVEARLMEKNT